MAPAYDADGAQASPTIEACLRFSSVHAFASPDDLSLQRTGAVSRS